MPKHSNSPTTISISQSTSRVSTGLRNRFHIVSVTLTALLLAGQIQAATETYYKWRNDSGTWSYGVIPPHGVEAIEVQTVGGATKEVAETDSTETKAADSSEESTKEYLVEEQNKPSKAEQKRLCEAAKTNLETLESSAVIRLRNKDGSVKALSDSERQQEIDTARKTIKDFC